MTRVVWRLAARARAAGRPPGAPPSRSTGRVAARAGVALDRIRLVDGAPAVARLPRGLPPWIRGRGPDGILP